MKTFKEFLAESSTVPASLSLYAHESDGHITYHRTEKAAKESVTRLGGKITQHKITGDFYKYHNLQDGELRIKPKFDNGYDRTYGGIGAFSHKDSREYAAAAKKHGWSKLTIYGTNNPRGLSHSEIIDPKQF